MCTSPAAVSGIQPATRTKPRPLCIAPQDANVSPLDEVRARHERERRAAHLKRVQERMVLNAKEREMKTRHEREKKFRSRRKSAAALDSLHQQEVQAMRAERAELMRVHNNRSCRESRMRARELARFVN